MRIVTAVMFPPTVRGLVDFAGYGSWEGVVIEPLRKLAGGKRCKRPPKIEAKLLELDGLSDAELIIRCEILSTTDPGFVPEECLVYLVRNRRDCDPGDSTFEQLYHALFVRVLQALHHQPLRRSSRFQLVWSSGLCNGNKCEIPRPEMRMIIPKTAPAHTSIHPPALASWPDRDRLQWIRSGTQMRGKTP